MEFCTNKQRGNAGLSYAIAYFGCNGYTVSIPLNDTQDYDLIVDDGVEIKRVQVKATSQIRNGEYVVTLKSSGGTKGNVYKRVKDTNVDWLFVLCSNMDAFLIPKDVITQGNELKLKTYKPNKTNQYAPFDASKFKVEI